MVFPECTKGDISQYDIDPKTQAIVLSVVPGCMILLGVYKIYKVKSIPRAGIQSLPSLVKVFEICTVICMCVLSVASLIWASLKPQVEFDAIQVLQHSLELLSWVVLTHFVLLEFRRFKVSPTATRMFYVAEFLFTVKTLETAILNISLGCTEPSLVPLAAIKFLCTAFLSILACRPALPGVKGHQEWWGRQQTAKEVQRHERKISGGNLKESLITVSSGDGQDSTPPKGDGPLSMAISSFAVEGCPEGFKLHNLWGLNAFVVYTLTVKWNKRDVWTVKRYTHTFTHIQTHTHTAILIKAVL